MPSLEELAAQFSSANSNARMNDQLTVLWGMAACPPPAPNTTAATDYFTDKIIEFTHSVEVLVFAFVLLFFFSGVRRINVRDTLDTLLEILPCYRDMNHGATSNTRFVIYYLTSGLGGAITCFSLLLDEHDWGKGGRIAMQVAQRILTGATTVLLTMALNHQREHRHVDALHGDIGIVQLIGQIRRINYSVVIVFTIFVIVEFGCSFATPSHSLHLALAWVSFVVAVVLNGPILAAAFWIVYHQGHVAPSVIARVSLISGVIFRFFGYIDPSFWNKIIFKEWTESDPCAIGGKMSFYNLMQIFDVLGQVLLLIFVVSEFRRSRSIVTVESSLIATAQYDCYDDGSSNPSEGDLQRNASDFN